MKAFVVLFLSGAFMFGQQMAPKNILSSNERKRFINTCDLLAHKLSSSEKTVDFSECFTITLSNENKEQLSAFKNELATYNDSAVTYQITQDASNGKLFTITFELGTEKTAVKKIFLLFEEGDNLIDDFMVIASGIEEIQEEETTIEKSATITILPTVVSTNNHLN